MKKITNWREATVFDVEADGFLKEATRLHVLTCQLAEGNKTSIKGEDTKRIKKFLSYHIDRGIPVVAHNGICYDIPLLEKLLKVDLSRLMVIDTLALSWYLNMDRKLHGLDSFFEDYGIAKPKVYDWEGLTYEEYEYRCSKDVDINVALWEDLQERLVDMYTHVKGAVDKGLVDGNRVTDDEFCYIDQYKNSSSVDDYIERLLSFLMYKMETARLRESTRILLDQDKVKVGLKDLESKLWEAKVELESIMPPVPQYTKKKYPKNPLKKDGTLSVHGKAWNEAIDGLEKVDEYGTPLTLEVEGSQDEVKILKGYKDPNINSTDQIKNLLFSKGWKPRTFKYVKDKDAQQAWVDSGFKKELKPKPRAIPQVNRDVGEGKELCPSVLELTEDYPEIKAYANYTLYKHRRDLLKGFIDNMDEEGYIYAGLQGFTNTLREQHRSPVVNLPGVDKPYGDIIRGSLTCKEDEILLGSDLSSLEDRVKHHFMLPYDPEYVKTMMSPDYDSHIHMALTAGMITQDEYDRFLRGDKTENAKAKRKLGKTVNYSSVYGASPETIAINSGMELKDAKTLHKAYWELNWAVKAIAEDQYTFEDSRGNRWLINPINGFCYSIRADKDVFSTLIQGTGSFFFDMWVCNILQEMYNRYKKKTLSLLYHDEFMLRIKDTINNREEFSEITYKAIDKVNETFKLRRDLGCDVQFGKTYADIH